MGGLVMVTGGSSGLGRAVLAATPFPAHLVDFSRSVPPGDDAIEHVAADLSDPATWPRVAAEILRLVDGHQPDRTVFVHAAGTLTPIGFAGEVDADAYSVNVLVNGAAGQVLGDAFLRVVGGRAGAHDLVMITSGAAQKAYPGWSSYGAGKAALDQWVRTVGAEQRIRDGVRVVAIAPGVLATAMQEKIRETPAEDFPAVERFRDLHRNGDLIDPETAAGRIWRLIEDGPESGSVIDLRTTG